MKDEKDDERMLEQLFAHAKARPMPPAADMDEIRSALYAEWDALTGRRVWLRRAGAIAAAAAAAAIVVWTTIGVTPPMALATVAQIERVQGVVGMRIGDALTAGDTLATGSGQLALRLASGGSLRLGPQTRLQFTGDAVAELTAGVVYFDSEGERGAQPFAITTALGTVRDVGTQFLVRVAAAQLEIGVREGRVALEAGNARGEAAAGDKLVVAAPGDIRRDSIAAVGDDWAWAEKLAPPFDIDGQQLGDFLVWFTQQTGREVVFADANAERVARETVLNGSIDLEPLPKLAAVMTLTDLTYSVDGARVVIASR
jgi:ferric-dicitrate binding protein FerR (iron transport regulator)